MGAPIKTDDLWGQWARNQWKPHYLFAGLEDFLIEESVQKAIHHWLGDKPDLLSLEKLDADSQTLEEVLQVAQTVPFFGVQKVLIIQNASAWTAKEQERLVQGLNAVDSNTHCLFIWGREWRRDDTNKPLVEFISTMGYVVIFWNLFPAQAERWVMNRAKHYMKQLTAPAAHWLVQQSGEGLRLLDQELAKCAAFVGNRLTIELEDAQTSFGYAKAASPFEWVASIRRQEPSAALGVLDDLLEGGEEPIRLLALISRSVRDWLDAKSTGENAAVLAMRFHIRRGEENRFLQELARWDEEHLAEALSLCVDSEESIKSGKETPEMALTLLTLGLCGRERAYAGSKS